MEENVISFKQLSMSDLPKVGAKNASLGEMIKHLSSFGIKVPDGFATTAQAYQQFLVQSKLDKKIYQASRIQTGSLS